MASILVTGGSGFIGSHLVAKLAGLGHSVSVIDLKVPESAVRGVSYVQGDVRDPEKLRPLINQAEVVYHLAATVSVPLCQGDPVASYSNNFTATVNVLDAIREAEATKPLQRRRRFAFASTAAIYGDMGNSGAPLREGDVPAHLFSYYAAQKHASEQAAMLYRTFHGIPALSFRFFNVFGPGQDPTSPYSGVITIFSTRIRNRHPLTLNGGGLQTRDFIHVSDIVQGLTNSLEVPESLWDGTPHNLGTGQSVTVRELAILMMKTANTEVELIDAPAREGDVLHSRAAIARARERLAFSPKTTLAAGLSSVI